MEGVKGSRSRIPGAPRKGLREGTHPKRSKKSGLPPGTPVYIGRDKTHAVAVTVIDYSGTHVYEQAIHDLTELLVFKSSPTTSWIRVNGIHDVDLVERIGSIFGIHHLVLEDIVDTTQRSKADDYGEYLFIVLRMLDYDQEKLTSAQMSLVVGSNFLLSFQEEETSLLEPLIRRIQEAGTRIRESGTDYLAYCMVDVVVDNYFVILEKMAEQTELLEEELLASPAGTTLTKIHRFKRDLLILRKSVWPVIQTANRLIDSDSGLIKDSTRPYLRDLYDHAIRSVDTVETFRDMVTGMIDIYLSSVNNRLNEIMKWLTMIATVFIPLTFLSGWYGMNFKNMPELTWPWGYPVVICVGIAVAVTMLLFFRKKKWL